MPGKFGLAHPRPHETMPITSRLPASFSCCNGPPLSPYGSVKRKRQPFTWLILSNVSIYMRAAHLPGMHQFHLLDIQRTSYYPIDASRRSPIHRISPSSKSEQLYAVIFVMFHRFPVLGPIPRSNQLYPRNRHRSLMANKAVALLIQIQQVAPVSK